MSSTEPDSGSLPVALITDPMARNKKRPVKVLEEEKYVQQLEKIVERDFFPDLKALRQQSRQMLTPAEIPTVSSSVLSSFVESSRKGTVSSPSHMGSEEQSEHEPPVSLSLGQFLRKYTSEDNASFETIMQQIKEKEKQKYGWMFLDEGKTSDQQKDHLKLPDIEKQAISSDSGSAGLLTWPFKNKNTVMFYPDGAQYTDKEKELMRKQGNSIALENSRFVGKPFDEMEQRALIQQQALASQSQACDGKIGPDGKVNAPNVAGYSMLPMTPTPARVLTDASPLMTWGTIEGTPVRINSGTPFRVEAGTPCFRIPDTPAREELAHSLAESAAKQHRNKRKQREEVSKNRCRMTGRHQSSLHLMSPAAQRLAARTLNSSRGSDPKLQASYTPDLRSYAQSPRTPMSVSSKSSESSRTKL